MKYSAGMYLPSFVCTELGKNLPPGPSPSCSIVSGAIGGFLMRFALFHIVVRVHHVPAARPANTIASPANRSACAPAPAPSHPFALIHDASTHRTPTAQSPMCTYSHV